ncbi:MAG: methyltransferase domain-containing protein [Deltaproteobacteria bacterium]|nr:methyltransferase domain-containing protein [Deltaproteobacteria bacterium]
MTQPGRYGVDAPGVVLALFGAATADVVLYALRGFSLGPAFGCGLMGLAMLWSSKVGKLRAREALLDLVGLRGDERVLDVGCGRGLVLHGAARRLRDGRAVGIDIWRAKDQTGNDPRATLANAAREGVAAKVAVQSADMRMLPFVDASFDAVVSSLAIHNVHGTAERAKALCEIVRVLKPGGRVALQDIAHTAQYARVLRACGLREVRRTGLRFAIVPPVRVVSAIK